MSAAPMLELLGRDLTAADHDALAARWITPDLAHMAALRRVDGHLGGQIVGRNRGDYSGILIPYCRPSDGIVVHHRIRRDQPDIEIVAGNRRRETQKYIQPPERGNRLYFAPGCTEAQLQAVALPLLITEGEFKTLAAWRLANHQTDQPRFLPVGVGGVWNWRGTIGKTTGPNGERRDEKGPIPDLDLIEWQGRRAIIAYDADIAEKPEVKAARWQLSRELRSRGAEVGFLEWESSEGKGLDDHLAAVGPDQVLAEMGRVDFNRMSGWRSRLLVTESGKPKPLLENACVAIESAPEWDGVLAYDEFRLRVVAQRRTPWGRPAAGSAWTESDDLETARWLQRQGIEVSRDTAGQAVQLAAEKVRLHEVKDYLAGLEWDGISRTGSWLIDYCRVASSDEKPNVYAMSVGQCWLISAVARIMDPGSKADHVLILEGDQGIGKSRAVATLAGTWFTDQLPGVLNDKDAAMQLAGAWIVELAELNALNRHEQSAIKAFLSRQTDRFRPPYGRRVEDAPRQCVFAGTTNSGEWGQDETGGRRYWPVKCEGKIDVDALARDRDQLWAEAVAKYRAGEIWWLADDELVKDALAEQEARFVADPWQEGIDGFLDRFESTSVQEILAEHLKLDKSATTQAHSNRVARCLRALGWERYLVREGKAREWRYRRKG